MRGLDVTRDRAVYLVAVRQKSSAGVSSAEFELNRGLITTEMLPTNLHLFLFASKA